MDRIIIKDLHIYAYHGVNIEEKIKEVEKKINEIITTDPYNYKFLLEDREETEQRKKDYENEKKEYVKYKNELETILKEMTGDL